MKLPLKWIGLGLIVVLVGGAALRTLSSREAQKQALAQQQEAQKQQASVELGPTDVVRAQQTALEQVLAVSGPLKAGQSAFVKAKVAGELQGLSVREGDYVKAGQTIARVDSTEYQARVRQAQQQAESARAQVDIARRTYDNNKSLVDQGFISRTALDTSSASLAAAEANFRAAQAAADLALKSLDDAVLRAPISGQVAQRLAQTGERVAIDARVVEIVDLSTLEVEASLSASDSMQVRVGQTAQLQVEGTSKTYGARVVRINPSAVAGSRAVLAYLALESTAGLRQGMFAQGRLALGQSTVLALPLHAVRTDKPQPYVQLIAEGKVTHQKVDLGLQGEMQGQPMVQVVGVAEGAEALAGPVGVLREGTLVRRSQGKP